MLLIVVFLGRFDGVSPVIREGIAEGLEFLEAVGDCWHLPFERSGLGAGMEVGFITVQSHERAHPSGSIEGIVAGVLCRWKQCSPIILFFIAEAPKVVLEGLIHPLRLAVGLRVKRSR